MEASIEPFLYASSVPRISKTEPQEPRPIVRKAPSSSSAPSGGVAEGFCGVGYWLEGGERMGLVDSVLWSRSRGSSSLGRCFSLLEGAELGVGIFSERS